MNETKNLRCISASICLAIAELVIALSWSAWLIFCISCPECESVFFRIKSMPHPGHLPGSGLITSGCIGQVYLFITFYSLLHSATPALLAFNRLNFSQNFLISGRTRKISSQHFLRIYFVPLCSFFLKIPCYCQVSIRKPIGVYLKSSFIHIFFADALRSH